MKKFALKDLLYWLVIIFLLACTWRQQWHLNHLTMFDNTRVINSDVLMRMIDLDSGILSIGPNGCVDVFYFVNDPQQMEKENSLNVVETITLGPGNHPYCFRVNTFNNSIDVVFGFSKTTLQSSTNRQGIDRRNGGSISPGTATVFLRSFSDPRSTDFWCILISRGQGKSHEESLRLATSICEKELSMQNGQSSNDFRVNDLRR
jgi:hypothetical protein